MEILKDIKQIESKLKQLFGFEIEIDADAFINRSLTSEEIEHLAKNITKEELSEDDINSFSDLIFQLKNYMFALSNFVALLLTAKKYESVFHFVKKIFVGQIGQIKYTSVKESYSFLERYFDRFVEIVKNCEIDRNLYLPLIIKAFESDKTETLFNWKRPAIEFMQNFFNDNEDWTISYLNSNKENKYKLLEIITDFNTARGIRMLIDDFVSDNADEEQNSHILKKFKRETFLELDKRLYDNIPEEEKEKLAGVFVAFGSDNEALTRLNDLYEKATSSSLRDAIAEKLEIIKSPEVKTEKQFVYAARRKVKEPQERTLGIPFDKIDLKLESGFPANNVLKTYLINIVKEENTLSKLTNLNYLFNVFEREGLENFAEKLYDVVSKKDDIKEAKWAIRFCALFGSENLIKEMTNFACQLFGLGRFKEAKYLTECLVNCGKDEVAKVFASNAIKNFDDENWKRDMLQTLAKKAEINILDIEDQLAIGKTSPSEIDLQVQRLKTAFLNGREYSNKNFEKISNFEPFKSLFKKLIWGEYKTGKLYNAFVLEENEEGKVQRKYLLKLLDEPQENFSISILHTLDIDDRFEKIIGAIENPLFQQFKKIKFDVKDYKAQTTEISNFNGMFVDAKKFVEKIQTYDFVINRNEGEITFSSLININEGLKLSCVVEFNKPINLSSVYCNLGSIYFFKSTDLLRDGEKHIYSKNNALSVRSLPPRYFDLCMTAVVSSLQ